MRLFAIASLVAALGFASSASAAIVVVKAFDNSTGGGFGAATGVVLTTGQGFSVTVNPGDLWNAGPLPRWSNADGLTGNLLATGSDESGEPANTLIGIDFGLYSFGPDTFPYGLLVGSINNVFKSIGTNYAGNAWDNGELKLHYWDSNQGDNTQFITANVTAVPEPATWAMMIIGFGAAGSMIRRRKAVVA